LSSRFTAGWKTEEEKREKTEGESMKTPRKWRTIARGKSIKRERWVYAFEGYLFFHD